MLNNFKERFCNFKCIFDDEQDTNLKNCMKFIENAIDESDFDLNEDGTNYLIISRASNGNIANKVWVLQ